MPDYIGERPRLVVDVPEEFRLIFDGFSKSALTRPAETRQTITDLMTGTSPLEGNMPIATGINQMLDLTDDGKDIHYDPSTIDALITNQDYRTTARRFRELDKEDERRPALMREVALLALDIYAERAFRYKRQSKRDKGRVA